jgi:hypothetical protein
MKFLQGRKKSFLTVELILFFGGIVYSIATIYTETFSSTILFLIYALLFLVRVFEKFMLKISFIMFILLVIGAVFAETNL